MVLFGGTEAAVFIGYFKVRSLYFIDILQDGFET